MNYLIHVSERSDRHIRKSCELSRDPGGGAVSPRCAGLVLFSAVVAFLTQTPALGQIAARYPDDKNIASDPAVIFADDFESYTSPSQLTTKWTSAYKLANIRIATESSNVFSGSKSLEFTLPISTSEVSNILGKRLSPEQDTVFLRAYTKFDPG